MSSRKIIFDFSNPRSFAYKKIPLPNNLRSQDQNPQPVSAQHSQQVYLQIPEKKIVNSEKRKQERNDPL